MTSKDVCVGAQAGKKKSHLTLVVLVQEQEDRTNLLCATLCAPSQYENYIIM